ncbi:3-(3-hydroxy-phenyl)propionate hydroxylase [Roseiarcus fermentans]|uniref:3-(3-hydroxy-phenyl)propionate hydroxylase n=1 Tax=Roseiarcus fermentans TaxID=1473586 RepID=A0A366FHB9_9HYPH|nr:bifunctional 3-(3-hydroxy-phenyl)propionate/3-hydroxycinnamic acid hydroxylase [Roseiarcus fermentans]RBP14072.1 3-(3-hydroxy-phenyl)propionate hydroxylase [Roseiarcus fermentans]
MNRAAFHDSYDVAIIGLGPTGLTLAHLLGRRGLRVLALEREPTFYANARAVYTDDECMRIFQAAGVAADLEADMLVDTTVQWVLEDGSVLGQLRRTARPYGWALSNFFYQPYLETKMEKLLERHPNVTALRGRELVGFSQDEAWVTIEHAASSGTEYGQAAAPAAGPSETSRTRARWLVACDGGRSGVRARLGIKMAGKSFPEPWLVVDIQAKAGEDCLRHLPYFNFHCDPKQPTVSCPQPDGRHRFEFLLMPGQTREEMEDPATVRSLLARHVEVDKVEVLRKLVYTFNALVAERWREGRVLIAGDAAHMTPQFMGQGMSSGVRDAYNLAWKLDAVLAKGADPKLIDSYESERKPHAREMIDISVKMKDFVSIANPVLAALRNVTIRALLNTPWVNDYLREGRFKPPPTYPNGAYFGRPRGRRNGAEGRPIPQPQVRTSDGRRALLDDVLGDDCALVGYACDPRAGLDADILARLAALGVAFVALYPYGERTQGHAVRRGPAAGALVEVEDLSGEGVAWFRAAGARRGHVAVIRPDKVVYAMTPASGAPGAVADLLGAFVGDVRQVAVAGPVPAPAGA